MLTEKKLAYYVGCGFIIGFPIVFTFIIINVSRLHVFSSFEYIFIAFGLAGLSYFMWYCFDQNSKQWLTNNSPKESAEKK